MAGSDRHHVLRGGCTERIRLGTTVLILGYRPPVLTAKAISSLDSVSEGRVILGVGVGWMREEFDVLGMPYDHRGKRADEVLQLFTELFAEDRPSWSGEYYHVPQIGFEPKPVNRRVPVWVGGDTPPAFRRAARFADGFHAAFQSVAEVQAAWALIRQLALEAGRDHRRCGYRCACTLTPPRPCPQPNRSRVGRQQMVDTIGAWKAIGVDHILLDPVARRLRRPPAGDRVVHD